MPSANVTPSTKETLDENQINALLNELPEWAVEQGTLVRYWIFPGFADAIVFVQRVAQLAEQSQHHPDIDIRYNRVKLTLVSHDVGGITTRDARMARILSMGFAASPGNPAPPATPAS